MEKQQGEQRLLGAGGAEVRSCFLTVASGLQFEKSAKGWHLLNGLELPIQTVVTTVSFRKMCNKPT